MNQAQVYRALLDQHSMSYWEINTYPGQTDPHKLSTGLQSLLHQDNMTYWKIETYHPAIQAQVYRDILDQDSMSY